MLRRCCHIVATSRMKTVAATGLLFFLICHDCAFAAASGDHHARDWSARAYNRRSLAQASNDEASTTADEPPNQCKVVTGNTTNSCFRTCMTCQASRSGPNHRPCTCCKAGFKQSRIAARCWQCEIGAFALAGDNKCTRCPTGYSTVSTASSVCDGESSVRLVSHSRQHVWVTQTWLLLILFFFCVLAAWQSLSTITASTCCYDFYRRQLRYHHFWLYYQLVGTNTQSVCLQLALLVMSGQGMPQVVTHARPVHQGMFVEQELQSQAVPSALSALLAAQP